MVHENSPSSVLYAELKALGISNYDAALMLLDAERSFGEGTMQDRIESRTQLSRGIVHAVPGELSTNLFRDFSRSSQALITRIAARRAERGMNDTNQMLIERLTGQAAEAMQQALADYKLDPNLYRNALAFIGELDLEGEDSRALLYMMLFVITGCTGDPVYAVCEVEQFSMHELGLSFQTPAIAAHDVADSTNGEYTLGLIRIIGGQLKGMSSFHPLSSSPEGTIIGSFTTAPGAITDVDSDVSRRHARVIKRNGRWFIEGMGSRNGTTLIKGDDKAEYVVEPPQSERPLGYKPKPVEILPTDVICVGATTRFMVLPYME